MTQQNWTEGHLRYCIAQRLTPTAIKLYQWLLTEMQEGWTEIIDLRDFQRLVRKERGKPHDFRVIQTAIERLADAGILKTCKRYSNFLWKWTIKPINRLLYPLIPKPKISQSRSQIPNLQDSNEGNAFDKVIAAAATVSNRTQPVDLLGDERVTLCEEAGIKYTNPSFLRSFSLEKVRGAIALFYARGGHAIDSDGLPEIVNPRGFVRDALSKGWVDEQENQKLYQSLGE